LGDWSFVWGAKPTKATPWGRDWSAVKHSSWQCPQR